MRAAASIFVILALLSLSGLAHAKEYVVGVGDLLAIFVWGEEELSVQTKVRPDGKISLPGGVEVHAADKTISALTKSLEDSLGKLVKNPIITVSLMESVNSKVYVVGTGVEPQVLGLTSKTTLLHLLASLGPLGAADLDKAYVHRRGKIIKSGFSDLFWKGDFKSDIELEPGDTIFIPQKENPNVFVLGAVNEPRAIFCREGLTVLDAILASGGFNKYADENKTRVVRKKNGKKTTLPVKAGDLINKGDLTQNIVLEPGDYIIVEEGFF